MTMHAGSSSSGTKSDPNARLFYSLYHYLPLERRSIAFWCILVYSTLIKLELGPRGADSDTRFSALITLLALPHSTECHTTSNISSKADIPPASAAPSRPGFQDLEISDVLSCLAKGFRNRVWRSSRLRCYRCITLKKSPRVIWIP
jgi:hypothetical protein